MLDLTTERGNDGSDSTSTNEARPTTYGSDSWVNDQGTLQIIAVVLCVVVLVLVGIIIYGYFKYLRGKKNQLVDEKGSSIVVKEHQTEVFPRPLEPLPEVPEVLEVLESLDVELEREGLAEIPEVTPVKARKRSMTFSESDEECRKYREALEDAYGQPETKNERTRKKSYVTFLVD